MQYQITQNVTGISGSDDKSVLQTVSESVYVEMSMALASIQHLTIQYL